MALVDRQKAKHDVRCLFDAETEITLCGRPTAGIPLITNKDAMEKAAKGKVKYICRLCAKIMAKRMKGK